MATKKTNHADVSAVISLNGKQYLVKNGQTLKVAKLPSKEGETINVKDVLLVINGESTLVGAPNVPNTSVDIKHDKFVKGDKVEIMKFRAKSRYRRHTGHRQDYSQITVSSINLK